VKTIKEAPYGKMILRLVDTGKAIVGIAVENGTTKLRVEGQDRDEVWIQLHAEVGKADPRYVGFAGARNRFLHFFPNGFHSPGYAQGERDYKVAAKVKLDETAPLDGAVSGLGFGEAVLAVFRATNLLSPFEKTWLQEVLRGSHADRFVHAAANFARTPTKPALLEMEGVLKRYDAAKWTIATYLPFLWRPSAHMFLKPEVTKDFALRVGHRFASDYKPRLDIEVYASLLDLASATERELSDLKPRDRIDVQSLIWVVGDYREGEEEPKP
jgi:hypothetical protein